jgi:folate-dependent phosphoribosylglycinamide formyltransferase PurN
MKAALLLNDDDALYAAPMAEFLAAEFGPSGARRIDSIHLFGPAGSAAHRRRYLRAAAAIVGPTFIARLYGEHARTRALGLLDRAARTRGSVSAAARSRGVPVLRHASVNDASFLDGLRSRGVTVALSACSQIFREPALTRPDLAIYNFHGGLLPRQRGRFPMFWALYRGEREQGMTCHRITAEIDAGPILFQAPFDVTPADDVGSLTLQFRSRMPSYLMRALDLLERGVTGARITRDGEAAFYGPIPTPGQIRELRARTASGRSV